MHKFHIFLARLLFIEGVVTDSNFMIFEVIIRYSLDLKEVTQKILGSPGLLEGQFNLIWPNCLQLTHCNLSQLSPRCPSSWQISQNSSGFDFDWFLFWTGENAGFDWLSPSLSSFLSGGEKNWFYYKFNFLSDFH